MKKQILLLLAVFTFAFSFSQTRTHSTKVKIKQTPVAASTDEVVAIKPNGLIVNTGIQVSSLGTGGLNIYNSDGVILNDIERILSFENSNSSLSFLGTNNEFFIGDSGISLDSDEWALSANGNGGSINSIFGSSLEINAPNGLQIRPGNASTITPSVIGQVLTAIGTNGETEWQNAQVGDFIPLSGTTNGNTVTGDVEFESTDFNSIPVYLKFNADFGTVSNLGYFIDNTDQTVLGDFTDSNNYTGLIVPNNTVKFTGLIHNEAGDSQRILTSGLGITIGDEIANRGLVGDAYYGANYTDNTYVQRKFVIDEIAASVGGVSFEGYSESGTKAGGDLLVNIGDHDDSNDGTRIIIDDSNSNIDLYFENSQQHRITSDDSNFSGSLGADIVGVNGLTGKGSIFPNLLTSFRSYELPDATGTIALTSDIKTQTVKVTLNASQVQNLNSTPIQLIASQGAGTFINVVKVVSRLNFNTTEFDIGNITIRNVGSSGSIAVINDSAINSVTTSISTGGLSVGFSGLNNILENTALEITALSDATQGDGTVDFYITYEVIIL